MRNLMLACSAVMIIVLSACGPAATPTPNDPRASPEAARPTNPADYQVRVHLTEAEQPGDAPLPGTGAVPTPPEPAVGEALRRLATPGGISEVVPGFGGHFLDPQDKSIVYVYMLDPSQQGLADEAARIMLGNERFGPEIREVRVLQAQYGIGQLGEWYSRMRGSVHSVKGLSWTDLNEGKNRIAVGFVARQGVRQEVEALVDSLGIPREAVIVEVGCRDVGQPYERPAQPTDPALQSLDVRLDGPSHVRPGQPVPFMLTVKNTSNDPVSVSTGLAMAEFVVTRPDGAKVWSSMCERGIVFSIGKTLTLAPNEEKELSGLWQQWDGQGEPVPPGTYLAYGLLDTHPEVPTAPVTFRIVP